MVKKWTSKSILFKPKKPIELIPFAINLNHKKTIINVKNIFFDFEVGSKNFIVKNNVFTFQAQQNIYFKHLLTLIVAIKIVERIAKEIAQSNLNLSLKFTFPEVAYPLYFHIKIFFLKKT